MLLAAGLAALLLTAADGPPAARTSGVADRGFGVEINASVGLHNSSGANASANMLAPQWEAGLRLRIGQFLSVGVSGEYVHGISGGAGDDFVFGPWARYGLASTKAYYASEGSTLRTIVLGIRLTVAVP